MRTINLLVLITVLLVPTTVLCGSAMGGMGGMGSMEKMDRMDSVDDMDMSMKGDVKRGSQIAKMTCGACHGGAGRSASDDLPSLAGQDAMYLMSSLMAYRSGKRNVPAMAAIAAKLSRQDIADVVAYYSGLEDDR